MRSRSIATRTTSDFPKSETYGLTSQIRRSVASVAANIAEGCGKRGNGDFQRFLAIAASSASEVEYHCLLAKDLGLLKDAEYNSLDSEVVEIKRMLAKLILKVESDRRAS